MDSEEVQKDDSNGIDQSADIVGDSAQNAADEIGPNADKDALPQGSSESIELDTAAPKAAVDNSINSALSARKGNPAIRAQSEMAIGSERNDRKVNSDVDSSTTALDNGFEPLDNAVTTRDHKLNPSSAGRGSDVLDEDANEIGEGEELRRIYGADTYALMEKYFEDNPQEFAIPEGESLSVTALTLRDRDQLFISALATQLEEALVGRDKKYWVAIIDERNYNSFLIESMPHVLDFRVGSVNNIHFGDYSMAAPCAAGDQMQLILDIIQQCNTQHDVVTKLINLIKRSHQDMHQNLKMVVGLKLSISWLNYHMSSKQGTMVHQMHQRTVVVSSFGYAEENNGLMSPIDQDDSRSLHGGQELCAAEVLPNVGGDFKRKDDDLASQGHQSSEGSNDTTDHSRDDGRLNGNLNWNVLVQDLQTEMENTRFVPTAKRAAIAWQGMVKAGNGTIDANASRAKFYKALGKYISIHKEIVIKATALARNWNRRVPDDLRDKSRWLQEYPVNALLSLSIRGDRLTRLFCAHYYSAMEDHGDDFRYEEVSFNPAVCTGIQGLPCQHFPTIVFPGNDACHECLADASARSVEVDESPQDASAVAEFLHATDPKKQEPAKVVSASAGGPQARASGEPADAVAPVLNKRQLNIHLLLKDLYEERTLDEKVTWAKSKITRGKKTCCGKLKRGHKAECLLILLKNQVTSHGKLTRKVSKNTALLNTTPHMRHLLERCMLPTRHLKIGKRLSKEGMEVIDSLLFTSFLVKEMREQGMITTGTSLYDQFKDSVDQRHVGTLSKISNNLSTLLSSVTDLHQHFINVLTLAEENSSDDEESEEKEEERDDGDGLLSFDDESDDSDPDEDPKGNGDPGDGGDGGDDSPSDDSDYGSSDNSSSSSDDDDEPDGEDKGDATLGIVGRVKARSRGSTGEKPLMNLEMSVGKVVDDYSLHMTVHDQMEFLKCLERGQGTIEGQNKLITECIDLLNIEDEILSHGSELSSTSPTQASIMKNVAKNLLSNGEAIKLLTIPRRSSERVAYNRDNLKPLYKHFTRPYLAYLLVDNAMIKEFKSKYGKKKKNATLDEKTFRKISENIKQVCTLVRRTFSDVVDKITEG